jgi:hypothetical protein
MQRERAYALGEGPCIPSKALHMFVSYSRDTDYCQCGKHQLGYYESRYIDVDPEADSSGTPDVKQLMNELSRLDKALGTLDALRTSGYVVEFSGKFARAVLNGTEAARGEGTSASCLQQLAVQLK